MARNEEKASNMMNMWTKVSQEDGATNILGTRPVMAQHCTNLVNAEKWRRGLIHEIIILVSKIQNAGLGEYMIRDINDDINKKLCEKMHWERQIVALGGPNYKTKKCTFDAEGEVVTGPGTYMYFGAAKSLPGVRELFEPKKKHQKTKRSRHEIVQNIDLDYYGYRDEEDGILLHVEAEAESLALTRARTKWEVDRNESPDNYSSSEEDCDDASVFHTNVTVPTQSTIESLILKQKKEALLARYSSIIKNTAN